MLTAQRKQLILGRLATHGQIVAGELALELGTSEDTIRRDLRELAQQGKLQRVHGGALPASAATGDLRVRQQVSTDEKQTLGRFGEAVLSGYRVSLDWALRHTRIVMLIFFGAVALNIWLFVIVPKGFFPQQDTGRLFGSLRADQTTLATRLKALGYATAAIGKWHLGSQPEWGPRKFGFDRTYGAFGGGTGPAGRGPGISGGIPCGRGGAGSGSRGSG